MKKIFSATQRNCGVAGRAVKGKLFLPLRAYYEREKSSANWMRARTVTPVGPPAVKP
jgi:hypothetical protein